MKRNILLGVTGSVAAIKTVELARTLSKFGDVKIVATDSGTYFLPYEAKHPAEKHRCLYLSESDDLNVMINGPRVPVYRDIDEWPVKPFSGDWAGGNQIEPHFKLGDPVLHIELRKWASCFVIAPLDANTLAKLALGLCDNLLTCVYRAWDWNRPVFICPAMNTYMWNNEPTSEYVQKLLTKRNLYIIQPVSKRLACNDVGMGAMAPIEEISEMVEDKLRWHFPLKKCNGIPINHHPGAFGFHRAKNHHTGVDLYTEDGEDVYAVEDGVIVKIDIFTGPALGHQWWEETYGVMIEGASGVVNYGEVNKPSVLDGSGVTRKRIGGGVTFDGSPTFMPTPSSFPEPKRALKIGDRVKRGQKIGRVKRVLFESKFRPDIPGHSTSMLHFELYKHGTRDFADWHNPEKNPDLLDPTPYLMSAKDAPLVTLTWDNQENKTVG